ncbi:MAG: bifunctional diaminohydroxyphosphoribosylaminopyrimidine deaminase/5-amino-6-(5-phosphoribosylamino)uracil reductase RibD [Cytophagales bacterium]|nr:MAG: bifunctional diaminohydroxyphosphoribosylaminopyrimidine deaminase/5-amino-6-(5-phosphoribosylamino)uracil reductase RibD [Cytophagales bacterium]TAF59943.1 MAG: bifunctional diaminohydroxyphosphoribosylaminopyrimidine deaminase/5-amino-6-(5-phosphoribosylamino)uracil reductase RibD [Cytophagales bacterium]
MFVESDRLFMNRALFLAARGQGTVSPNPMVGCVVVYDGRIIGEGWHERYGGSHAEVNALKNLSDSDILAKSTVYVNLEPCAHYGKTPPCALLLIQKGIKNLVVAQQDPNPLVSGKGIELLAQSGAQVRVGLCEREAKHLNRRFLTNILKKRAYILLKYAQSADGYISQLDKKPIPISNALTNRLVHKWRAQEDAILVGSGTVLADNPRLSARFGQSNQPIPVVLDRNLSLSQDFKVFKHDKGLVFHQKKDIATERQIYIEHQDFLKGVFEKLYQIGIGSVLVEGGQQVHEALIKNALWDEARVIVNEQILHKGLPAPKGLDMSLAQTANVADDRIFTLFRESFFQ